LTVMPRPTVAGTPALLAGKRGLIMGVANDHSIAWGIARAAFDAGAELAFTYQGEAFERRVRPLAETMNAPIVTPCDVEDCASLDSVFAVIGETWGSLDFVVHAIASRAAISTRARTISAARS
jgi:enoyl-[acyl-carrier protein] reductase I